ncbi:hypothetical protein AHAS_Ahas16G0092600 [Arachis hypogaea]
MAEKKECTGERALHCIYNLDPLGFERLDLVSKDFHIKKVEVQDPFDEVEIGGKGRVTYISQCLDPKFKKELIEVLKRYQDCFAWQYKEMIGLDRSLVEHELPLIENARPIK